MLKVEAIEKSFNSFRAVKGANLVVDKGKVVAVIGPNGSGKTTLFNLITGQLKPDKGRIIFEGEDITKLPPYQIFNKRIGRSFQIVDIFLKLTVFENVQVSVLSRQRKIYNFFTPAKGLVVKETTNILESLGLLDKSEDVASSLSHGDQKMLEIAMALGGDPKLLILDEPTAGMSPGETLATMERIKWLASNSGLTILFCEHNLAVVFFIAQEIMVMYQGCTIVQGKPDSVRSSKEVQDAYLGGAE